MTRKFIKGDVVRCFGNVEDVVNYVGNEFLKTDKGWIFIESVKLVRPFNKSYEGQHETGILNIDDYATEDECVAFMSTKLVLSRIMEK